MKWVRQLTDLLRQAGPYAALGLILPGGSVVALTLWSLRRGTSSTAPLRRLLRMVAILAVALALPGTL